MINDLKSIGTSQKIVNPNGKKARKGLPFSTQRRKHWFHVVDVRATVGCRQILKNCA